MDIDLAAPRFERIVGSDPPADTNKWMHLAARTNLKTN